MGGFNKRIKETVLDEDIQDRYIWTPTASGRYSYRFLRKELHCHSHVVPCWRALWWVFAPPKVKTFMWLLIRHRLSLRDRLFRLRIVSSEINACPLCGDHE